jgi:ribosomal protein L37AE/L43A
MTYPHPRNPLMVNAERRRPLPPGVKRQKGRSVCGEPRSRSHASLGRDCVYLLAHRPSARPNRLELRHAIRWGRTILAGCAFALAASAFVLVAVGFDAMTRRKKSRLACCTETRPVTRRLCCRDELAGVNVQHPNCTKASNCRQSADEHPRCPRCRRWRCVVALPDGIWKCNSCKLEWRIERPSYRRT